MTKADMLEELADNIIRAGFDGSCPFFRLFDVQERPWPLAPHQMSANDALEYFEYCYGPTFAGYMRERPQFTTH